MNARGIDMDSTVNGGNNDFFRVASDLKFLGVSIYAMDELKQNWPELIRTKKLNLLDRQWIGLDKMELNIRLEVKDHPSIKGYAATFRKEIQCPIVDIGKVHTVALDKEMDGIAWSLDPDDQDVKQFAAESPAVSELVAKMEKVRADLQRLKESDHPDGPLAARQLMLYHWLDTPWEKHIPDAKEFKNSYDIKRFFSADDILFPKVIQARSLLDGSLVGRETRYSSMSTSLVDWFQLDMSSGNDKRQCPLTGVGYSDLRNEIGRLPIREKNVPASFEAFYGALLNGEKPNVHYQDGDTDKFVKLSIKGMPPAIEIHDMLGQLFLSSSTMVQEKDKGLPAAEKIKKVLTGNQITPNPSNHQQNAKKHGM